MPELPAIIAENGFTLSWDEREVWKIEAPVEAMPLEELAWHFDLPFWNDRGAAYSLSARQVMNEPERYAEHFQRIGQADTRFPIDIAQHPLTGKWVILDGLHRLVKSYLAGNTVVSVRKIPLQAIPKR